MIKYSPNKTLHPLNKYRTTCDVHSNNNRPFPRRQRAVSTLASALHFSHMTRNNNNCVVWSDIQLNNLY